MRPTTSLIRTAAVAAAVTVLLALLNGCTRPRPIPLRQPPYAIDTGLPMSAARAAHEARLRLRMLPLPTPIRTIAQEAKR